MAAPQPDTSATDTIAVHLDIYGQVQGVGYRHAMQTIASKLQLRGWVRNRGGGRVEALVQGPFDQVARLLVWCQSGPPQARVDQIEQQTQALEPQWGGVPLQGHGGLMVNVAGKLLQVLLLLTPNLAPAQQPVPSPAWAALAEHRFSTMAVGPVAAPWRIVGLPGQKFPLTRSAITQSGNTPVLQLQANASYGNLVFDMQGTTVPAAALLRWRWQLERAAAGTDLRRKDGDDAPLKVCALFDMPLSGMSFAEQSRLRIARAVSGEALPAATLCYVWDQQLPVGSELPNIFSPRVRYLVVSQGPARPGQWMAIERNLASDFMAAFGHETSVLPPLLALAVGADTDNTGSASLSYVGDLRLSLP